MTCSILKKSWRQHPTRHQLYVHLSPISKTIQLRRTRHAEHCCRSRDELISDVLLWTPTYGRAKARRLYHRTNVLCWKERILQKKKYSSSKVREENINYYLAMIAATRKVHFSWVLLLSSFRWWRGVGKSWLFDTRLTDRS